MTKPWRETPSTLYLVPPHFIINVTDSRQTTYNNGECKERYNNAKLLQLQDVSLALQWVMPVEVNLLGALPYGLNLQGKMEESGELPAIRPSCRSCDFATPVVIPSWLEKESSYFVCLIAALNCYIKVAPADSNEPLWVWPDYIGLAPKNYNWIYWSRSCSIGSSSSEVCFYSYIIKLPKSWKGERTGSVVFMQIL